MDKSVIEKLEKLPDVSFFWDQDLHRYTTMRLHVNGNIAEVKNVDGLKNLIEILINNKVKYQIIGWGANQILESTNNVLFIKLDFLINRSYLDEPKDRYILPASISLNILTGHAKKYGLIGWEVFTGVPASLGGAIFMNAGTNLGEICDIIESVKVLKPDGKIIDHKVDKDSFSYRSNNFINPGDVIIEAVLLNKGLSPEISTKISDYLKLRKKTQPLSTKNCGCVYKNHSTSTRAGHFIDLMGLKGYNNEKVRVSHVHGNFFENYDEASADNLVSHINNVQMEIEQYTGIKFELEVNVY